MASATASAPPPTTNAPASPSHNPSALKTNLSYLIRGPANSPLQPKSFQTRSTLRSLRYLAKFIFWRLLRYGKYALIAAGATALAGTALGTALPWIAAIAVPSVPVAAAMGLTTAVIKFTWNHRGNHFRQGWLVGGEGRDARTDERMDAEEAEREFNRPSQPVHPRAANAWGRQGFTS
ncbi:hypothetical protein T439DRAFT_289371 [Meredithblackwellia eburnea MCA 4105]